MVGWIALGVVLFVGWSYVWGDYCANNGAVMGWTECMKFLNDSLKSGKYTPEAVIAFILWEANKDGENGDSEDQR